MTNRGPIIYSDFIVIEYSGDEPPENQAMQQLNNFINNLKVVSIIPFEMTKYISPGLTRTIPKTFLVFWEKDL